MDWYLLSSTLSQQLYFSVLGKGQAERSSSREERKKGRVGKKWKIAEVFSPFTLLQQTSPLNTLQVTLPCACCALFLLEDYMYHNKAWVEYTF